MQADGIILSQVGGRGFRSPMPNLERLVKGNVIRNYVTDKIEIPGQGPFTIDETFNELVRKYGTDDASHIDESVREYLRINKPGHDAKKEVTEDQLDPNAVDYLDKLAKMDLPAAKEHAINTWGVDVAKVRSITRVVEEVKLAMENKNKTTVVETNKDQKNPDETDTSTPPVVNPEVKDDTKPVTTLDAEKVDGSAI